MAISIPSKCFTLDAASIYIYKVMRRSNKLSDVFSTTQVSGEQSVDREKRCLRLRRCVAGAHFRAGANQHDSVG